MEPAAARLGAFFLEPTVDVELSWVDNLYRTRRDETDSWILQTTPRIDTWLQNGPSRYGLLYELQDSRYSGTPSGEDDDFTDHRLRADIHHEFNARNLLELFAQHHITHEERGTGLTEGRPLDLIDKPIEYDQSAYGGEYTFGNRYTEGMLEIALERREYEYQNFRNYTRYFDYDVDRYRGTFYWNLSGKTALLFEGSYLDTQYERQRPDQPSLDADEVRFLVGASWEATARTRGTVKLGAFERDFDAGERESSDGYSWDIQVNYRRKSYSVFDFGTRQVSRETNGLGDFINSHELSFNWWHQYTRGYRSNVNMLLAEDDYSGIDRDDIRLALEFTLGKPLRRWLDLGVGWRYEDRDSDYTDPVFRNDALSYSRNSLFAFLKVSL